MSTRTPLKMPWKAGHPEPQGLHSSRHFRNPVPGSQGGQVFSCCRCSCGVEVSAPLQLWGRSCCDLWNTTLLWFDVEDGRLRALRMPSSCLVKQPRHRVVPQRMQQHRNPVLRQLVMGQLMLRRLLQPLRQPRHITRSF